MGNPNFPFRFISGLPKDAQYQIWRNFTALAGAGTEGHTVVIAASNSRFPARADFRCNGSDDHLVIQRAIDSLGAAGGRIVLLEGDYQFGATGGVSFSSTSGRLTIQGQGLSTRILNNAISSGTAALFDIGAHTSFILRDLYIAAPRATASGSKTAVRINGIPSDMDLIADVRVGGGSTSGVYGIYITGTTSYNGVKGIIRDCQIELTDGGEAPGNAIVIDGQPWAIVDNTIVTDSRAVSFSNITGLVMVGNKVRVVGSSGTVIDLDAVNESLFVGNVLHGNARAITFSSGLGSQRNLFVGNRMAGGGSVSQTVTWSGSDPDNRDNVFIGTLVTSCGSAGTGLLPPQSNNYAYHTISLDPDDPSDGNHSPGAHVHNASDITSGVFSQARIATGTASAGTAPVSDGSGGTAWTDIATQSELDAHLTDTVDAHDASAISIADVGGYFTSDHVEGALQELGAISGGGSSILNDVYNVVFLIGGE